MIIGKKGAPRGERKKDGISLFFQRAVQSSRQATGEQDPSLRE